MSQLKFKCPNVDEKNEECGRRFSTQKELETHIKTRHPKLFNLKKETKEEKEKKMLDNLFSQINSFEKFTDSQGQNFHQKLNLPEIPNYDDIIGLDDDKEEVDVNYNIIKNENKEENEEEENSKNEKEENEIFERPKSLISNKTISQKLYNGEDIRLNKDENKINEITEDMIFGNKKSKNYNDIKEINLSKKKIASFLNNKKIPFENLEELIKLNLSYNFINNSYDLRLLKKLKFIDLSNNSINEISFVEFLPDLEYLNVEKNQINSITSLNQCTQLEILKISSNKIEYENSTMRTLQNLRNLHELTIKDNPFLDGMFSYKNLFIHKFKNLQILDNQKITEKERENADKFVIENNPIYKSTSNRPMSSKISFKNNNLIHNKNEILEDENEEEENNNKENNFAQTIIGFHKKTNQIMNEQNKNNENIPIYNTNKVDDITLLQKQNKELYDLINKNNEEIESLKKEIEKLKHNNKDNEKEKLKEELSQLKKDYKELLDKTMSTNISSNKSNAYITKNNKNEEEEEENIEEDDEMDLDEMLRKSYQDFAKINKDLEKLKNDNQITNPMSNKPKINTINNNKPKITINNTLNKNNTFIPNKVQNEKLNPVVMKKELSNRPVIIKNQKNDVKVVINPKKK